MSEKESNTYITPLREAFEKVVAEQKADGETREVRHLFLVNVQEEGADEAVLCIGTDFKCYGALAAIVWEFIESLNNRKCPRCEGTPSDEPCTKY